MSGPSHYRPKTAFGRFVHSIEETAIAVILGLMTLITFVNVVLRYVFNESLIWGLEVTLILFAWLVLLGISYGFKVTSHLGVDALINLFDSRKQRVFAIIAGLVCVAYALLLLKGAWDYWAPFAALQPTEGRWLPTGFTTGVRDRAFYVTDQVPMLGIFRWLEGAINYGEAYDKLPRVIPYVILPFSTALIVLRVVQALIAVIGGRQTSLIVSHEAEDAVADAAQKTGV
ncbi:TRAP transporter small permease [Arenibacterium halophilum]|uniref:TRAP transporter small permease protein n=1 Tax=Arenibacterium halophilum TaxID=2583821 RepID=A0ABY2XE24_9RHOB|nr:TRAP transporter small permease [Arenibacterium halophilum]MAY88391.1 TRAP transporter permease DctQ [Pseudooceanicola sp.]TMV14742.1 TRAP transporter small permease [Arenibacterium halophilum]|tara:strand:+ start:25 stop:711 length:687 start_codon:yes stop_codon:yes gene_type:complete